MRKKKLLEVNHGLFRDLENFKTAADELRKENVLLRKSIEELEKENKALKNNYNKNEQTELSERTDQIDSFDEDKEEFPKIQKSNIKLPPMVDYASSVIGKIVISAAKRCSILSDIQDNPDSKDMINLILGRTEVSKAEILKILSNEAEDEVITNLINEECSAAEDYFQSVMAQL